MLKKLLALMLVFAGVFTLAACNGTDEEGLSAAEKVAEAKTALLIQSGQIVSDITLPSSGLHDVTVTWSSSDEDVIAADGSVTRPANGEGNADITLTATITLGDESDTKTFDVIVKEEEPSNLFTTIATLFSDPEDGGATYGSTVEFQGVVAIVFGGGYFLTDGTDYLGVYNKYVDGKLVPEVGDEVYVKGEYTNYNSLYQIGDPTEETVISSDNDVTVTAEEKTISELQALDSTDKLIHGKRFIVTGILEERADGNYTDLYLVGSDSAVMVYYDSLAASFELLEDEIGNKVTIPVEYYADHTDDGVLVLFSGGADDITVIELTDTEIAQATLDAIDIPTLTGVEADLDLPTSNETYETTISWASDNEAVIATDGTVNRVVGADTTVVLTATVDVDGTVLTKEFTATVIDADDMDPITVADALLEEDGTSVLVQGVVTGFYYDQFFIQDGDGTAIYVDVDLEGAVVLGDSVILRATKSGNDSYQDGNTQPYLDDVALISVESQDNTIFVDDTVTAADLAANFGTYYSERLTMDLTVEALDDGFGYIHFVGADGVSIKFSNNYAEYFEYLYAVDDVVTATFNVYKLDFDNLKVAAVELPELTDTQKLDAIEAMLTEDGNAVTIDSDVEMPTDEYVEDYGVTISWATSDATVFATDGTVTQPAIGEADATVTVTATLTIDATTTRDIVFTVTVPAMVETVAYDNTETFTNFDLSGTSYGAGTFTGDNSISWDYTESRGDFVLDGQAIMLDKDGDGASLTATITGGIGALSVEYYDAYSGSAQVVIIINEGLTGEMTYTSDAVDYDLDETGDIATFTVTDINIEGEFTISVYSGESQMVIDNLQWNSYTAS